MPVERIILMSAGMRSPGSNNIISPGTKFFDFIIVSYLFLITLLKRGKNYLKSLI